ncbi:unnamed protein product [Heligmosomoides polygyrus]|uniref:Signal transduction histidine kinase n=1 Tax=Heligmosomoides polygyrus TaxID=6339 RepID=A0A183FJB5_HELPZ|nr:unnamed protein product [Heligmosomoides polygyrus]
MRLREITNRLATINRQRHELYGIYRTVERTRSTLMATIDEVKENTLKPDGMEITAWAMQNNLSDVKLDGSLPLEQQHGGSLRSCEVQEQLFTPITDVKMPVSNCDGVMIAAWPWQKNLSDVKLDGEALHFHDRIEGPVYWAELSITDTLVTLLITDVKMPVSNSDGVMIAAWPWQKNLSDVKFDISLPLEQQHGGSLRSCEVQEQLFTPITE